MLPSSEPSMQTPSSSSTSTVIITISANDLRDTDINSVSDPFCVLSTIVTDGRSKRYQEVGRTEVINNCLDPEWYTKMKMTYYPSQDQRLKIDILDKGPPKKDTFLGSASLRLRDIVNAKMNRVTVPLFCDGKQYGTVTVVAEEMKRGRQESIYFVVSATKLDKKDFLGKCDPFLKLSRINYDNTLHLAFRTRYREQNLNPKWKPFEISVDQLCYGDKNRNFLIECYDWDQDGNHDLVGSCVTTINYLLLHQDAELPLIHEKKARKSKKYLDSGLLHFQKVYCWCDFSFQDFVNAGTVLDFTVAVGFPTQWDDVLTPRRQTMAQSEQFEMALLSVAEICQLNAPGQQFHAYGYGGRLPHVDRSHTVFPLNVETGIPTCESVPGLIHSFRKSKTVIQPESAAHFAPIIRMAAQRAQRAPSDGSLYFVLILITDGTIADLDRTKQEVVKASGLPLSIIIVGVGYDNFAEMKELDSDNHMLSWNGKAARRDIVQFVQLRSYLPPHKHLTEDELFESKKELAKEVLQELPLQLTSYMKSKGIAPMSAQSARSEVSRSHAPLRSTLSDNGTRTRRMLPQIPVQDLQQQLRI